MIVFFIQILSPFFFFVGNIFLNFYFFFAFGGFLTIFLFYLVGLVLNSDNKVIFFDQRNLFDRFSLDFHFLLQKKIYFFCKFFKYSLFLNIFLFLYHVLLFLVFDLNFKPFQIFYTLTIFGISLDFGVDGISLLFLLLTSFIIPLCIIIHYYWIFFTILQNFFFMHYFYSNSNFVLNLLGLFLKRSEIFFFYLFF